MTPRRLAILLVGLAACSGPTAGAPPAPVPAPVAAPGAAAAAPAAPTLRLDRSVVPTRHALALTLDPRRAEFAGTIAIDVEVASTTRTIWMHGQGLSVDHAEVSIAGAGPVAATAEESGDFLRVALARPIGPGPAQLRLSFRGAVDDSADDRGIFRQAEGGHHYLFTQFQPVAARRAFPCFDEPSFKAPWEVTLDVPAEMVAVANAPAASEVTAGGRKTIAFAPTPPLPSYLVAFAVGPFDVVEVGRVGVNQIPMRLIVPHGRAADTGFARDTHPVLLRQVEAYFGTAYPFAKVDAVAVPSFVGAMENAGLITYDAWHLLVKPGEDTPAWRLTRAVIAAHEMAHHWLGDLVTPAWWDEIWLNESLAEFVAVQVVDAWQPTWGVGFDALRSTQQAFALDGLAAARTIRNPVRDHASIPGVFDAITYAKGRAVIDMFAGYLGDDAIRDAIRRYVGARAWGTAVADDFLRALGDATRPEVATALTTFLDQGGVPLVSVALECNADGAVVVLSQQRLVALGAGAPPPQRWSLPVCVRYPDGSTTTRDCTLLTEPSQRLVLTRPGCPAWIDASGDGRGYYRVRYGGALAAGLLAAPLAPSARAAALWNHTALTEIGAIRPSEVLTGLGAVMASPDPAAKVAAIDFARGLSRYLADEDRARWSRYVVATFGPAARSIGWAPRVGESAITAQLRPRLLRLVMLHGGERGLWRRARALARQYLRDPATVDVQLAEVALLAVVRGADPELARALDDHYRAADEAMVRETLLAAMALADDATVRRRAIARLPSGVRSAWEALAIVDAAEVDPRSRDDVYAAVVADVAAAAAPLGRWQGRIVQVAAAYCDAAHRDAVDAVFAPAVTAMPAGTKALAEAREALDQCITRRRVLEPDLQAFLRAP